MADTLMSLGPVVFDHVVTNLTGVEKSSSVTFAQHDVIGAEPILEATGGEGAEYTLTGIIHPEVFGVNGSLAALETAMAEQLPLPLMRGDYTPLGWHVITKLTRSDASLNEIGFGREITFTVTLRSVGSPDSGLAQAILGLFS